MFEQATEGAIQKFLVVDLDVHQGNGIAKTKHRFSDTDVHLLDMYNEDIFPNDSFAESLVDTHVKFHRGEKGADYLPKLQNALRKAKSSFQPDMIMFNAGTDVLEGDPLGCARLTIQDVVKRDEIVFAFAKDLAVPICMVLSGGYTSKSPQAVEESIFNLIDKFKLAE